MSPAREPHPARHFALLYSPASQHAVLEALFGIEREVSASLRPGLDHQVAHTRLQWWREECERAASGRPEHPLTRALVDAFSSARSPAASGTPLSALAGLSGFVDVAVWDLAGATFESRRELTAYCERWAAAMVETLAASAGASQAVTGARTSRAATMAGPARVDAAWTNWRAVGALMREIELVGDLAREAHYGRLRLPLDELDHAKVDPAVLAKPPWPNAIVEIVRARHRSLRVEIARALADVDNEQQPALRGLLVWTALACRWSERAEHALPDRVHPGRFDAITDAWFAWRVARKATIGRLKVESK